MNRNGFRWNINECLRLQREYELLELPLDEIARRHGRTVNAIMFRLDYEGFADYTQLYNNYYECCQGKHTYFESEDEETSEVDDEYEQEDEEQSESSDDEEQEEDDQSDAEEEPDIYDIVKQMSQMQKQINELMGMISKKNNYTYV